jgi:hypothetical protein
MKQIILDMIQEAEQKENYELAQYAKRLINELANTINAPSTWRNIGSDLAEQYTPETWVHEELELWNHEEGGN